MPYFHHNETHPRRWVYPTAQSQSKTLITEINNQIIYFISVSFSGEQNFSLDIKGSVSSRMPCTCRLLDGLCFRRFHWPMKMATTKANEETERARNSGWHRPFNVTSGLKARSDMCPLSMPWKQIRTHKDAWILYRNSHLVKKTICRYDMA